MKNVNEMTVNEMTMGERFGYMMAGRGVTTNSTTLEVMTALVDTTRQATESVAEVAGMIVTDFVEGCGSDYMKYLTDTKFERVTGDGEVVKTLPMPGIS
tara:strand:- start:83 stop:379 length:297 start_codon:yes stop_codon:yes gene_type:complete